MATAKLHHSVSRLLQHTIANFCRERVTFGRKLRVVGLVALTIDDEEADVLMKMDETFVKEGNGACEEEDEEDDEDGENGELRKRLGSSGRLRKSSVSPMMHVDSSTSMHLSSSEEARHADGMFPEEADSNFCLLEEEEEVMPLPPPLSSVIDRLRDDVDGCENLSSLTPCSTAGSERIQICTSTSIVTPLFHHKQKRKRFRPMRHCRPFNGFIGNSDAAGSHSSEEPPSPGPYPSSNGAAMFSLLSDVDSKADLPLPPLPSSDTASGGEEAMELSEHTDEGHENQAIILNGIDCSTTGSEDAGDLIPMSPVPGDIVEDVGLDDEELQITGEDCRPTPLPLLPSSLPPSLPPPPPPPQLTAVTLPLLSLPLTGTTALNSIPLIPLRQVTTAQPPTLVSSSQGVGGGTTTLSAPRQFALIAPGTGILLPSASGASATATAAAFLATATKSLTLTAAPASASATTTTNSFAMSLTSGSTAAVTVATAAASKTKLLTASATSTSVSTTRSRRSTLKIHHSPLTIPAAAAALRPLPTMTSSASVASSLMRHYNCRYCGKTFNRKFCLERHERLHTGVKPYACSCCGERFIRLEDKKRHVRTVHEPQPPGCGSENGASVSGDDGGSDKGTGESPNASGGANTTTSAHMLSIISAVAAAAAASTGGADRKVGAVSKR